MKLIAGRYEKKQRIQTGGMGEVWRGYDKVLERDVAIKLIRADLAHSVADSVDLLHRFRREAYIGAQLSHRGVPTLYDADLKDEQPFIVMELIHGRTLTQLLDAGPVAVSWAVAIAAQICAVLARAHEIPVVHRDIKPDNIIVGDDGTVYVLDFGIAALLRDDAARLTHGGALLGTRQYMAPEQIQGEAVDARTDLYAVGCLLYELIVGEPVFAGAGNEYQQLSQHVNALPQLIREAVPGVDDRIEDLVLRLLAKVPAERPPSARAVYEKLSPLLPRDGATTEPGDPTRPYRDPLAPPPLNRPQMVPPPSPQHDTTRLLAAVEAANERANALIDQEEYRTAIDVFAEALDHAGQLGTSHPLLLDMRLRRATALHHTGENAKALAELERLDRMLTSRDVDKRRTCRIVMFMCLDQLGQRDKAAMLGEKLQESGEKTLDDGMLYVRLVLGDIYVARGYVVKALMTWRALEADLRTLDSDHPALVDISSMIRRHADLG